MIRQSEYPIARERWRGSPLPARLRLYEVGSPSRTAVQDYVRDRYARAFGATLTEWMPTMVTLETPDRILAAAGYRCAVEPLFLERYLTQPIEQCLGFAGERHRIVEVGQFAAHRPGDGRALILPLVEHLADGGYVWVVMTVTRELKQLFERMGLSGASLGAAHDSVLTASERLSWGRYYQHAPIVVGGRLDNILYRLNRE